MRTEAVKHVGLKNFLHKNRNLLYVLQILVIITAFSGLLKSDSYFLPYLIICVMAFVCMADNYKKGAQPPTHIGTAAVVYAFLFSLMITYANYNIWTTKLFEQNFLNSVFAVSVNLIIFSGVFLTFINILVWISYNISKLTWKKSNNQVKPLKVFFASFGFIGAIYLIVLFCAKYPGILTIDSFQQIQQGLSNEYTNHHPLAHTLTIKLFIDLGMAIFNDINSAVALYSVFSILLMASSFAFSVATLAEIKTPKWICIIIVLFYGLMPYHILYSMTMWKDIMFGAFVLQFVVFLFRCKSGLSLKIFNYIGLMLSSIGVCLYRSNGLFVFIFIAICFLCIFKLKDKKILLIMLGVIICSFIFKYPVLKSLGIPQAGILEGLSIPEQQIARDIIDNDDFSDEDLILLGKVIDVERVPEEYKPYTSDYIKALICDKDNVSYLEEHLSEFGHLYISRILKHPFTYIKAWIDETRGYWNSGYTYPRWGVEVYSNDLGIESTENLSIISSLFKAYYGAFQHIPVTQLFLSIGFFNWIILIALYISILRRDKLGMILPVPAVMIAISLLISTPIFAEFRYDYGAFCVLPVIVVFALRPDTAINAETVTTEYKPVS